MDKLTVSELTKKIKLLLERNPTFNNCWVSGEISNFKHHSSGHMYFTLKDEGSSIRCVIFRSRSCSLLFRPENGMKVIVRGNISVFERDGQYQLYAEAMQPDGIGALHIAFEQLKSKLKDEGLFSDLYKKELPFYPRRVGLVTSPTGAAIRDMINVLSRRCPSLHIVLVPVAVQGNSAPDEIADAIRLLNSVSGIDIIIAGRGGGSLEELWAFNTEVVARSIFESEIPIISAVGHETDFTIADMVADLRAPTPSAAAELAVPDKKELQKHLLNLENKLTAVIDQFIKKQRNRIELCLHSSLFQNPKDYINQSHQQLDYLDKFLHQAMTKLQTKNKNRLSFLLAKLDSLSPLTTLERGYSICQKEGQVIKDITKVDIAEKVEIVLNKGKLICSVEEKFTS